MTQSYATADVARLSPNFGHLAEALPLVAFVGARAERAVFEDPVAALMRLRQFGELLAKQVAASIGVYAAGDEPQHERLRRLRDENAVDRDTAELFHALRMLGNAANHEVVGTQRDALHALRQAWRLGVWYRQGFLDPRFKSGAFTPPPDPRGAEQALKEELQQLREALAQQKKAAADLTAQVQSEAELRAKAKAEAKSAYEDLEVALDMAGEAEARAVKLEADYKQALQAQQVASAAAPRADVTATLEKLQAATAAIDLDESETRVLIDAQLRAAGWEADSVALRYKAGARPSKGRNVAIAEWPTGSGPADYVLFAGLVPIAVVEAKRRAKSVVSAIEQAKRYSRDYTDNGGPFAAGAPWGDYNVPFLFATNGRPFQRQLLTQSGIYRLDARRSTNHPRSVVAWPTPEGLLAELDQDIVAAEARLKAESSAYLPLRSYQRDAIGAVETSLAAGQRDMLLALATGTGKTRLALCLMYRLLKAGRFRRVLFLVDRTALGTQASEAFAHVQLESLQSLTEIYDVKGLGDLVPEPDTRVHVATVQGMVHRLQQAEDGGIPLPVDWYDLVIVDECHRGYALDREMSDDQLMYRNEMEYISKYRRVLDHFDAVRIGLTATPALHTTEIFSEPVFEYGYRKAVIDGYLIDHEPPIRIETELNQKGIHWQAQEEVKRFNTMTAAVVTAKTPDAIDIDVDGFNTRVLTENFNRVVCTELARHIDPSLPGKTMVFCATDAHADLVVMLLNEAFEDRYGQVDHDAVMKITGAADKPHDKLRLYKNERLPSVAVTVDLLTTGIDVPEITALVFIRRVKSRILYEQMIGRATRLCSDLYGPGQHKERFRIFDAVELYAALEPFTTMKPVVTRPNLSFAQLVDELTTVADPAYRQQVLQELTAKLQVRRRRFNADHHEAFQTLAGRSVDNLQWLCQASNAEAVVSFFATHADVATFLDGVRNPTGREVPISEHPDTVLATKRGYGKGNLQPADYLESFRTYIETHRNELDALLIVTQRPSDLTRAQLRELKLKLDAAGYSESSLRVASQQLTNRDIAASIIGFIRQQALGSALVPYDERVDRALQRVLASQAWTDPQRKWLERIGRQLKAEVIVDREALDRGQFQAEGGFGRINRVFDGRLEQVLHELQDEVWREVG